MKLTKTDDMVYTKFREDFPDFNIKILDPDLLKSAEAKEVCNDCSLCACVPKTPIVHNVQNSLLQIIILGPQLHIPSSKHTVNISSF